ncbi:MAG TPA: hypothetical protein PKV71_01740 [Calditrichia bacterium]|nr:hypothetical protein [Calditrichia bacterium]
MKNSFLQYLVTPAPLAQLPADWHGEIFRRDAPLGIEIGFGNGEYLVRWHHARPDWNLVGIELSMESCERLMKRLVAGDISPVRVIHDNARFVLRECFGDNSVSRVVMNCPDPWPKDKHKERRLIDAQFAETLSAVLTMGGQYELVTDQPWYAEDAHAIFSADPRFALAPLEKGLQRSETTRYERKWLEMNREMTRLVATKIAATPIERKCKDNRMPHAFIDREIRDEFVKPLCGLEHREGEDLFIVKSALRDMEEDRYILKVVAADQGYRQSFLVQIKPHETGRWLVKLDPSVQPYRTPAVKMAIRQIAAALVEPAG